LPPGHYAVQFAIPLPGPYRLETTLSLDGRSLYVGRRGLVVGYADELRLKPTGRDLLRAVAETSGDRYDPRPDEIFTRPDNTTGRTTVCLPYLLCAATLIFLADVALKRIDLARKRPCAGNPTHRFALDCLRMTRVSEVAREFTAVQVFPADRRWRAAETYSLRPRHTRENMA
jgi:hypothetical protein